MADEDPQAGGAVEEPTESQSASEVLTDESAPAVVTPDLDEAVPASAEQEPSPDEGAEPAEKPDEATEEPTTEQAREATIALIAELAESDPETAAALKQRLGIEEPDVGEEKVAWELEKGRATRTSRWQGALATYEQYKPEAQQAKLERYLGELNGSLQASAKALADGDITDPGQVRFDPRGVAAALAPLFTEGQGSLQEMMAAASQSVILDPLEAHPAHRHLTPDERTQYQEAVGRSDYNGAIKLHLDAAIRAAPEHVAKEAKTKAEKDAGVLDRLTKLQAQLGKSNGKAALTGGAPKREERSDAELLEDESTPVEKLVEIRARQQKAAAGY